MRAIWANKPFIWQIYPQADNAHHAKLAAFLDMMNAPLSMRARFLEWNGMAELQTADREDSLFGALSNWQHTVTQVRECLLQQEDLVTQLMRLVSKNL